MNGWLWSTIYHTRDTERTEILDYIFAYSMVFISFYSFLIRILHRSSKTIKASLSAICFVFFMQHSVYLYYGKFDYNYNMMANVFTGKFSTSFEMARRYFIWIFYRFSRWYWLADMVLYSEKKKTLYLEVFHIRFIGDVITYSRTQGFRSNILGFRRSFHMAFVFSSFDFTVL